MVKINFVNARHKRRKKVLKLAKGYFGSKSTLYKTANEQVMRSLQYAYRDRRQKKRNFRKLWITRINAGCVNNNISYSRFIHGLLLAQVEVNRKILADMAYQEPDMFASYVELAKEHLSKKELILAQQKAELTKQKEQEEKAQLEKTNKLKQVKKAEAELAQQKEQEEKDQLELNQNQTVESTVELTEEAPEEIKVVQEEIKVKTNEEIDLNKMLVADLKKLAKKYNIENFSKMKKADLIESLEKFINKN
ncbi:50S ribosomal protein L20 [Candidatus Phytoplasma pruni]|uniref:Large ribosomal subunit protein bL20 n=1 Tax=Candidatus Phytoplasma pruni TaxID=479893 RepID=A0A851HCJ7_9MOLU|nr:50S ribosomal protein L20 [Candidatus Phytoplasma pruni]NWN45795.1 50S ribosomal protein L20 [Candidatus Phytoplasma pruni]